MSLNIIDAAEKKAPTPSQSQTTASQTAQVQPPERTTSKRLKLAIAAGFVAGIAMGPKLWLTDRGFPIVPALPGLGPIPAPFDGIALALMLVALVAIAFTARPARWIAVFAAVVVTLAAADQMRWQPWPYQYLWMLGALGLYASRPDSNDEANDRLALNICRFIIFCTYFWSGIQKMNSEFINYGFPFVTEAFTTQLSPAVLHVVNMGAYAVPVIESALAIGLLLPRFRKLAAAGILAMHVLILVSIGPYGRSWNSVIWPWNFAMMAFVAILFLSSGRGIPARDILWPSGPGPLRRSIYPKLVLLMLGLVPALSLFNRWDAFLSFSLYSGGNNDAHIRMKTTLADRLPKNVLYHVFRSNKPGFAQMNLLEWSFDEINIPIVPEVRVYKSLGRYFCSFEKTPGELQFFATERHNIFSGPTSQEYSCATLAQ